MFANRSYQSAVRILVCLLGSSLALGAAAISIVVEPTTVSDAWTFALNAIGSDDQNTYSEVGTEPPNSTPVLVFRGFDFSGIPSGAALDGIEVYVEGGASGGTAPMWFAGATTRKNVGASNVFDYTFAQPAVGAFPATAADSPEDIGGSPTDPWAAGNSQNQLTLPRLNHPNFALTLGGMDSEAGALFRIDNVFLTVHYTDSGNIQDCEYKLIFEIEWPILADALGLMDDEPETPDAVIPERWGLAMVRQVLCKPGHPWNVRTFEAFNANLVELQTETVFPEIEAYQHVVAALLLINTSRQNHFKALFGLEGEYLTVRNNRRAVDAEVFSDAGDLDGDGHSNTEEYNTVKAHGGSIDDFAEATSNPNLRGVPLPAAGWLGLALLALGLILVYRRYSRLAAAREAVRKALGRGIASQILASLSDLRESLAG